MLIFFSDSIPVKTGSTSYTSYTSVPVHQAAALAQAMVCVAHSMEQFGSVTGEISMRITTVFVAQMCLILAGLNVYLGIAYMNGQSGIHPVLAGAIAMLVITIPYYFKLEKYL